MDYERNFADTSIEKLEVCVVTGCGRSQNESREIAEAELESLSEFACFEFMFLAHVFP